MDLSFKQKSLLGSLAITLLVFGNYFLEVGAVVLARESESVGFREIINLIILVAVLEAIIHALLHGEGDEQLEDERDRLIERLAYRNAYWCLCIGIWFLIGQTFMETLLIPDSSDAATLLNDAISLLSPYVLANLLLLFFILSEVTMLVSQLYYYHKS